MNNQHCIMFKKYVTNLRSPIRKDATQQTQAHYKQADQYANILTRVFPFILQTFWDLHCCQCQLYNVIGNVFFYLGQNFGVPNNNDAISVNKEQ